MTHKQKLIIYTDLDGTLLDHQSYRWTEARQALEAIKQRQIPLILCSSKTFAEIRELQTELQICQPFIFENGAGIAMPKHYFQPHRCTPCEYAIHTLSADIETIHDYLKKINQKHPFHYEMFSTLPGLRISAITGLTQHQAELAQSRHASEPLLWGEDDAALQLFISLLAKYHLKILSGGRFHTVIGDSDKGRAIGCLQQQFQQHHANSRFITLGLGDSSNDLDMFNTVDHAVLIRNPHIQQDTLESITNINTTRLSGPAAWNQAVLDFICHY